jgi:hypothetical protein
MQKGAAPEIKLLKALDLAKRRGDAAQHVIGTTQPLEALEAAQGAREGMQIVGAQVQSHQGLAVPHSLWQSLQTKIQS